VKKGGARLLGRAAVRPFDNIINDLKFRLHSPEQRAKGIGEIADARLIYAVLAVEK
jgi:hypothetical protein